MKADLDFIGRCMCAQRRLHEAIEDSLWEDEQALRKARHDKTNEKEKDSVSGS